MVVLLLGAAQLLEALLAHGDARLAQRMRHYVRDERVQRPGVVGAAQPVIESAFAHMMGANGILAVFAHVGDDVREPHHAALQRHGTLGAHRL